MIEEERRDWLALSSLCLGFFLLMLDSTITSVALPDIVDELNTTESVAMWVNSGYLVGFSVPLLSAGRIGDRYGHRRVYACGLAVFTATSLACAVTGSIEVLIVLRVIQGLGAALMTPQCLILIRAIFDGPQLAVALAMWSSAGGAAAALGPLIGGFLVQGWGWPAIFVANLPVGLLGLAAALRWIPRTPIARVAPGLVAVSGTVCGVLFLTIGIQGTDPSSILVWGVPRWVWAAAGLLLIGVVLWMQRGAGRDAVIPLELLKNQRFRMAAGGAASAAFCVGSAAVPLMLQMQGPRGFDAFESALLLVPMGVACVLAAPIAARLNVTRGPRPAAIAGSVALVLSIGASAALVEVAASAAAIASAFVVFGLANALVWSPFSLTAVASVPRELVSSASALFNAMKQLGAVIGSAVTAILLSSVSNAAVLGVLAICGGLSVVFAIRLPAESGSVSVKTAHDHT